MKTSDITVDYIQHVGSDLMVVNAARVSFDKESEWEKSYTNMGQGAFQLEFDLAQKDTKLINYLASHKHFSPFNHSFITVRVKAPIFVARQLVKHKFMPWNEVSRRYVDDEPEFFIPKNWRAKAENVKQGSGERHYHSPYFSYEVGEHTAKSLEVYKDMIRDGVCAEQARMVLPQNMMTTWFWSGTLGAFCDMLKLRLDPHTQYESRIVAQKIREIIEPLFPVSVGALLKDISE